MTTIETHDRDFSTLKPELTMPEETTEGIMYPIPNPKTLAFLSVAMESGVYSSVPEDTRKIIETYYFVRGAKLQDLTDAAGVEKAGEVKQLILETMETMWNNLPPSLQEEHLKKEVIRLKHSSYSIEHRQRMSKQFKGKHHKHGKTIGDANRGRTQSKDTRRAIGEKQEKLWQDSTYREKMLKAFQDRHIEATLWREAQGQDIIETIISNNLLSPAEIEILRHHFEPLKKTKKKGEGIDELFERFSIAVARLA